MTLENYQDEISAKGLHTVQDDSDSSYGDLSDHEMEALFAIEQSIEQPVRTSSRAISPPPLKRHKSDGTREKDTAHAAQHSTSRYAGETGPQNPVHMQPATPQTEPTDAERGISIMRMFRNKDKKVFVFKWTAEMELDRITDKPWGFRYNGPGPLRDDYQHGLDETISHAVESLDPNDGGFVYAPYGHSAEGSSIEQHQDVMRIGTECIPACNNLCRLCQHVVKESGILNRPWGNFKTREKNAEDSENLGPISELRTADYVGPKVNFFGHHGRLGELRRSAKAGCHLCSLLDAFDPKSPFTYDESSKTPYDLRVIYAEFHDEGPGLLVVQAKGHPGKATYLYYGEPPRHIAPTLKHSRTDAPDVIALAKQWLDTCLTTHKFCRKRSADRQGFIPTRLIKVTATERIVQSINLVLGSDLEPQTEYLTLSHCWGGANIVKLLQETLVPFQSNIPLSLLPKNFSDAVLITHLLGYSYIWIDSLCIIQDSADDWSHEAALMGSVYRHSVCTIAAVSAQDSHGGCFFPRYTQSFTPCQLLPKSDTKPGVFAENWQSQPKPLHTRAWVVQERCLAVRTLNFGSQHIFWDCICATASEQEPQMEETIQAMSLKRRFYDMLDSYRKDSPSTSHYHWLGNWWELLSRYTACDITFKTDKWPAISGLATEIQRSTNQTLIHGLWSNNLADELLWTTSSPKPQRLNHGAPSWSWLSVDSEVHRRRYNYEKYYRVDATVRLSSPAVTEDGAITSPAINTTHTPHHLPLTLSITARLLRITWVLSAPRPSSVPSYPFRFRDGRPPPPPTRKIPVWDGRWTADTSPDESWETFALQIVRSNDDYDVSGSAGLVVVPVNEKDVWRRVGFWEIVWRDKGDDGRGWGTRNGERWFGEWRDVVLI